MSYQSLHTDKTQSTLKSTPWLYLAFFIIVLLVNLIWIIIKGHHLIDTFSISRNLRHLLILSLTLAIIAKDRTILQSLLSRHHDHDHEQDQMEGSKLWFREYLHSCNVYHHCHHILIIQRDNVFQKESEMCVFFSRFIYLNSYKRLSQIKHWSWRYKILCSQKIEWGINMNSSLHEWLC